jgi:hypothetical protein
MSREKGDRGFGRMTYAESTGGGMTAAAAAAAAVEYNIKEKSYPNI